MMYSSVFSSSVVTRYSHRLPMMIAFFFVTTCHSVFAQQPFVSDFFPKSARQGDTISIIGKGFTSGPQFGYGSVARVDFGSNFGSYNPDLAQGLSDIPTIKATSFSVLSDTLIKAVVSTGATRRVRVVIPGNQIAPEPLIKDGFKFIEGPFLFDYSKSRGNFSYPSTIQFPFNCGEIGDTIRITCEGAADVTQVAFGGIPAPHTLVNANTLQIILPIVSTGSISVTKPIGTSISKGFVYLPSITNFSPASAKQSDTVTINGSGFSFVDALGRHTQLITRVGFGAGSQSVPAQSFTVLSPTQIKVVVGTGASGSVVISRTLGGFNGINFRLAQPGFTFIPTSLTIQEFSPTFAKTGDTVLITGTGFTGTSSVTFGGVPASAFTVLNSANIKAVVGAGTSGNVAVTTPGGTATKSGFTFLLQGGSDLVEASFPYPSANGEINVVTLDGKGGVYVAGKFSMIGNVSRQGIAHILANRTVDFAWNPDFKKNGITANTSDCIKAIAVTSRGVHVGGDFTHVNNQPQSGFATVDFTQGNLLPSPQMLNIQDPIVGPGAVLCMAVDSLQNIYVAGDIRRTQMQISRLQAITTNNHNHFCKILANGLVDSTWGNGDFLQVPHVSGLRPTSIVVNSSAKGKQFLGEGVFINFGSSEVHEFINNRPIVKYSLATGQPVDSFSPEFPVTEFVNSIALIHVPTTLSSTPGQTIFQTVLIAGGKHFTTIDASTGAILPSSINLPLNTSIAAVAVNDARGEIFIGGNFRAVNGRAFSPVYETFLNNNLYSVHAHSLAKIFYSPETLGGAGVDEFKVNTQLAGGVIDRSWGSPIFSIPPTTNDRVFALASQPTAFGVFVGGRFQQVGTRNVFQFPNGYPLRNLMHIGNFEGIIAQAPIFEEIHGISKKLSNNEQHLIHAYPNPATGMITVEAMMENSNTAEITLVNALGHSLKSWQGETNGSKVITHLDLSTYPPGIYRVQMVTERGESRIIRIIKQ